MPTARLSCPGWTLLILLLTPLVSHAQEAQWQFGSAPSFSSGKYGTDTRTDVLYTPISVRRLFDSGDVTLVFPFTCIWGSAGVTIVNGSPARRDVGGTTAGREAAASTSSTTGRDTRGASSSTAQVETTDDTQQVDGCGLGDIVARARYYVVDERGWAPTVAVRAHLKAPTASAERGFGTGRPDEGVGVDISKTLPGDVVAMVDAGYTFVGKPEGIDYTNAWWYDVGIGRNFARGVVNLSVFFEEYGAIVPGLASARDILAAVSVGGAGGWRVQVSGEFGLSDGAPDHGVTFGASRRF